jgi:signal transduction histidine kinase
LFLVTFSIAALTGFASSLMNLDDFRQFSIAYVILFVGIGMLVTWEWTYSVWFMLVSFSFTVCAFYMNSTIPVQDIMANGGFSTISVACLGMIMIYSRYRSRFNEVRSRLELANSIVVVELKTRENNALNEQLHQNEKTALVGEISSSIAHELNTPLAVVRNASQALTESVDHVVSLVNNANNYSLLTEILEQLSARPFNPSSLKRIREVKRIKEQFESAGLLLGDQLLDLLSISGVTHEDDAIINRIVSSEDPVRMIKLIKHLRDIQLMNQHALAAVNRTSTIISELKSLVNSTRITEKNTVDVKESIEKALRIRKQNGKLIGKIELDQGVQLFVFNSEIGLLQLWLKLFELLLPSTEDVQAEKLAIHAVIDDRDIKVVFTGNSRLNHGAKQLYQVNSIFQQTSDDLYDFNLNMLRTLIAELHVEIDVQEEENSFSLHVTIRKQLK